MIDHRGEKDGVPRRPGPATDAIEGRANALIERMRAPVHAQTRSESDEPPTDGFEDRTPPMPDRFGRFRVLGRLGSGAMGIVFSAHDPLLDRDVAVKLMQPHRVSPMALARASREAQAMARVSHPNVVQVYGIGHHGDALYVAMEFVDGDTLAFWRESEDHDWTAVLAAYRQAGQGLAALHEHGLVHRDFKPANAMRGHDGRVRVLDLGLVRQTEDAVPPDVPAEVSESASVSSEQTETNAVLGTPAYMSPEQFLGEKVSPASDQFSFCIALYEALYGQRPFKGRTTIQLVEAIADQRIESPPSGSAVPNRVFRALSKGLARNPAARHGSMRELLDALEGRRRRPLLWAGATVVALVIVGVAVPTERAPEPARCEAAEAVAAAWNDAAQMSLVAVDQDGVAARELDAYAAELRDDAERACASALPSATTSACQQRLAARFDEVLTLMSGELEPGVTRVRLVEQLPAPSTCWGERITPRDADPAAFIRVARLAQKARGLSETPDKELAEATAQKAVEEAHRIGDPQAQIEAMRARAMVRIRSHQFELGLDDVRAAYDLALVIRDDDMAAQTANSMVWVLLQQRKLDEAERWARIAQAAVDRTGREDPSTRGYALHRLGLVKMHRGDSKEALDLMSQALQLWQAADDAREVGTVLSDLQQVAADLGDMDASLAYARDAVETYVEAFGENDPQLGTAYHNLGNAQQNLGQDEAALDAYQRAYENRVMGYGTEHPQVGISAYAVATALFDVGRQDEVSAWLDKTRRSMPKGHPALSAADMLEAQVAQALGDVDRALLLMNRALVEMESLYGADHPNVGQLRVNKAVLLRSTGEFDAALAETGLALDGLQARFGPKHPLVGRTLEAQGNVLLELERWDEAARDLQTALEIQLDVMGEDAEPVARLRAQLAKAKERATTP